MIAVLGASGFLGSSIFRKLKEEKRKVIGTYFSNKQEGLVKFDLRTDNFASFEENLDYVIFTAAHNPTPEKSVKNSKETYYTNCVCTKKLIDSCFERGIVPIYFSTDNVFDGEKGDYNEKDKTNPLNLYGRIKCEIEKHLIESSGKFLLLRMGKTFRIERGDATLFTGMKSGDKLTLATDQVYTPLWIKDLADFITLATDDKYEGVFHLASVKPTTRYEIAEKAREILRIPDIKITPCSIDDLRLVERRPKKIDLNVSKYCEATGKIPLDVAEFLRMI